MKYTLLAAMLLLSAMQPPVRSGAENHRAATRGAASSVGSSRDRCPDQEIQSAWHVSSCLTAQGEKCGQLLVFALYFIFFCE